MASPEGDLIRAILEYLELRGIMAWRNNKGATPYINEATGRRRYVKFGGKPGASDIFGVLQGGRFLAIETKIRPRKPTPDQRMFMIDVNAAGGLAFPAWTLDDVVERFEQEDADGN